MREIKFRAWDKNRNKMLLFGNQDFCDEYGNLTFKIITDENGNFDGEYFGFGDLDLEGTKSPIMQYTGLKDKNGKEIYEGDIVRNRIETDSFTNEIEPLITHEILIVKFDNGAYFIEDGDLLSEYSDIEIIGNIYENPELLNN